MSLPLKIINLKDQFSKTHTGLHLQFELNYIYKVNVSKDENVDIVTFFNKGRTINEQEDYLFLKKKVNTRNVINYEKAD